MAGCELEFKLEFAELGLFAKLVFYTELGLFGFFAAK